MPCRDWPMSLLNTSVCCHIDVKVDWVQCDSCELWFHLACIGVQPQEVADGDYHCHVCQKRAPRVIVVSQLPLSATDGSSSEAGGSTESSRGSVKSSRDTDDSSGTASDEERQPPATDRHVSDDECLDLRVRM